MWLVIKYVLLFLFTNPVTLKHLKESFLETSQYISFLTWFSRTAPIIWHKPDIFHLQWSKGVEEWIFLKEFGIKIVLSLRGSHINYSPVADEKLADAYLEFFPQVNAFHGVNKEICREAEKYGSSPDKCKVVYSGLDTENFNFGISKCFNNNTLQIVSVGRPHWIKGYHNAIDAAKILKEKNIRFTYRIIGGKSEELIYQINELGLDDCVFVEENLPFDEVKSLINGSEILLMSSVQEGIPNVILEAMALGTVVLATDCGGVAEVIKNNINGFLVPIRNPLAIAEKIQFISQLSQNEIEKIRLEARATIEHQHNHQKMVDDMKSLYQSTL